MAPLWSILVPDLSLPAALAVARLLRPDRAVTEGQWLRSATFQAILTAWAARPLHQERTAVTDLAPSQAFGFSLEAQAGAEAARPALAPGQLAVRVLPAPVVEVAARCSPGVSLAAAAMVVMAS